MHSDLDPCGWRDFTTVLRALVPALYCSDHDDENMKARHFGERCFRKEDEDSKEAALLFDKAGHGRQNFQGWPLCHDSSVSTFQKRWVAVLQGEHNPFEFVSAVLMINIFHGEQYWQVLVGYSIAMAKRFLNNIINTCCNRFILMEPMC